MEIPPIVFAVVVGGMAITLIVLPKNRRLGYALYACLAAYVMLQLVDTSTIAISVPTVFVPADMASLMPVALITGLLMLIVLVIKKEEDGQ